MKQRTIPEIAAYLLQNDNYIMLTHRRPDGDTIGCAAALCGGLRALGKTAAVWENPQFTAKFRPYLDGLTTDAIPRTQSSSSWILLPRICFPTEWKIM